MNILKEKIFNKVYDILNDNRLIVLDENTPTNRNQAFEKFSSSFEKSILLDNDLSSSVDQILSTLDIDSDLKSKHHDIYEKIIREINLLKLSINAQEYQIKDQQKKVDNHLQKQDEKIQMLMDKLDLLEKQNRLRDIKINAYELTELFRFYFVDKAIRVVHKNISINSWSQLTSKQS